MGNDKSLGLSSADYGLLYAAVMAMRDRLVKEKPKEKELHKQLSDLMDKIVYAEVHHTPLMYDNK